MHYTGYGSRISCLNLTFLHGWCALNRLSNANFDATSKKNTFNVQHCGISVICWHTYLGKCLISLLNEVKKSSINHAVTW
jgi:hypothetical protein